MGARTWSGRRDRREPLNYLRSEQPTTLPFGHPSIKKKGSCLAHKIICGGCNLLKTCSYIIIKGESPNPKTEAMKRLSALILLVSIFVAGSSFKLKRAHTEQFKNDGYFMASIDGKTFAAREDNKYTAELMNKSLERGTLIQPAAGTKLTRVATTINFYGADMRDDDDNTFTESVGLEYTFNEGSTGEAVDQKVILNYNNQRFTSIPAETKIHVSKIQWSSDKRTFTMSGDFDAKMLTWGAPGQPKQTLRVKGKMEDVVVSVPSWIMLKSQSVQTADDDTEK